YNMVDGRPVFTGSEFLDTANQEIDRSDVFRGYLISELKISKFTARIGSRYESVATRRNDKLTTDRILRQDDIWIPGGGVSYQLSDDQMLFFGVHKGITLPGPGEVGQVKPEEALNYEIGYRLRTPLYLEVVGFYSDYQNLLGTCTFSAGCTNTDLDRQFNSGKVEIAGVETQIGFDYHLKGYHIPIQITNTYTQAEFSEDITSANKIWGTGEIRAGDPLPYIPEWKTSASVGVKTRKWSSFLTWNYQSRMFDQSVQEDRQEVDAYSTFNFNGSYNWSERLSTNLKIQNITNERYIVSLRPFGARPGAPFWATAGLTYKY
ncbi:MAG: TonB-dependent receptor, partial [Pseudomonadota bacterium]